MAEPWYNSTGSTILQGPGTPTTILGSAAEGDTFWSGVGDYFTKWDPVLIGPIIEGVRADDEAKKREKALGSSPEFQIPESYDLALEQLRKRQKDTMPGYDEAMAGIQQETAANVTGAQQLSSGPEAIMAQSGIYGDQQARIQDLGMRASQWQQQQQQQYAQMLQGRAGMEMQQFEYNQWLPWQIQKNEIASLRGAGQAAQQSGADTMGAAGVQAASIFSK